MKPMGSISIVILSLAISLNPSDLGKAADRLSLAQMQSVIEFLSHDLLEGRAPGTRGGNLAEVYMQSLFKLLGLEPGMISGYMQPFPLAGFQTRDLLMVADGQIFRFPEDFIGVYTRPQETFSLQGEAVFVGFGIRTPIWDWDDYKRADLKDKILLVRVNDPGMYIPGIFEGKALTYFGRWRYKIEEAVKCGAAGILLIHTDASAGYDWSVVQNSWVKESLFLKNSTHGNLRFQGWIQEKALKKILDRKNISLEGLYRKSLKKNFKPMPLNVRLVLSGKNSFRETEARNVVAKIPGKSQKEIVLSAHIDHLGAQDTLTGDRVFNGAIDNASAVATLVLVAKILKEFYPPPNLTLTFLACQAEEEGLLGAQYYIESIDRERVIANINFESTPVWESSLDVMGIGARYSTLEEIIRSIAARQGWKTAEFSLSNQGFFYRSDQFPFARAGIPSVWLSAGEAFASGINHIARFFVNGNYHTTKDEFDPDWPLESLRQTVKLAVLLVERLDESGTRPTWKGRLTFPTDQRK